MNRAAIETLSWVGITVLAAFAPMVLFSICLLSLVAGAMGGGVAIWFPGVVIGALIIWFPNALVGLCVLFLVWQVATYKRRAVEATIEGLMS